MKFRVMVEYEYPVEHRTPVKAELTLHGDSVVTGNITRLPNCDMIDRQAAIDAIKDMCEHYTPDNNTFHPHVDFIVWELQALPSVAEIERSNE